MHTYHTYLSHNIGLLPSDKRLELQEVHGQLDIFLEIDLSVQQVFALVLQKPMLALSDHRRIDIKHTASCFSRYNLMVAPELPVPDSRTTILDPSSNLAYRPWFLETLPSMGSM